MKPETILRKLKDTKITINKHEERYLKQFFLNYPESVNGLLPFINKLLELSKPGASKRLSISTSITDCCDHCGEVDLCLQVNINLHKYCKQSPFLKEFLENSKYIKKFNQCSDSYITVTVECDADTPLSYLTF